MKDSLGRERQVRLPDLGELPGEWVYRAACANKPTEWFFPQVELEEHQLKHGNIPAHMYDNARYYCRGCPVRLDCLDWAIKTRQKHGMCGGKLPNQRNKIAQKLKELLLSSVKDLGSNHPLVTMDVPHKVLRQRRK